MNHFKTNKLLKQIMLNQLFLILSVFLISTSSNLFGQTITSVSPNTAVQGTTNILVAFIINGGSMGLPPSNSPVNNVTIGTIVGSSLTHNDTIVTGIFNIPFDENVGVKDVAITFVPPPDQGQPLVFTLKNGFTVTSMPETSPVITKQPKSQTVRIGKFISLSVVAYGSAPMHYKWQKDESDIPGDTSSSFKISAFSESDVASYRCLITNDFGSVTSEIAELTVNSTFYPGTYPIVDSKQEFCYNDSLRIEFPA